MRPTARPARPVCVNAGAEAVRARLARLADPARAAVARRFFKTGPGEYGAGDVFIGVAVPALRKLAREYADLPLVQTRRLLTSRVHEERLLALLLLVRRYARGDAAERRRVYHLYLGGTRYVNNWDLVDGSAAHIVGEHLSERSRRPLYALAKSPVLWERRIAIMATHHFIRRHDYADTLRIARVLLGDDHDLIHKAVGWMLREVGKRDRRVAEQFLRDHHRRMPRTMLRYAIERFPPATRRRYLQGKI